MVEMNHATPRIARTSATSPLRIATIPVGPQRGAIGVTLAPGKHQNETLSGVPWARDLGVDLQRIVEWGASDLISLIEPQEFKELQIEALPERARALALQWHGLPVVDGHAPGEAFLGRWIELGPAFARGLTEGRRIVVHCKGGLGRAGTVACMLLLECGAVHSAAEAIAIVRIARPGAIETQEQERFLATYAARLTPQSEI